MNEKKFQVEGLKYQLSGHFLFNILNTIRVLIKKEPEKACDLVTLFSDYMRYAISKVDSFYATLEEEHKGLELFFKLQEIRFHTPVELQWKVPPAFDGTSIPAFILQPVAESIFKKSSLNEDGKRVIWFEGEQKGTELEMRVFTLQALPDRENSHGLLAVSDADLGLEEAEKLLKGMGHPGGFTTTHEPDNRRMIIFTIPMSL